MRDEADDTFEMLRAAAAAVALTAPLTWRGGSDDAGRCASPALSASVLRLGAGSGTGPRSAYVGERVLPREGWEVMDGR